MTMTITLFLNWKAKIVVLAHSVSWNLKGCFKPIDTLSLTFKVNETMTIEELKQRALQGDAEAICDLGMAYSMAKALNTTKKKRLNFYKHLLMQVMNMLRSF